MATQAIPPPPPSGDFWAKTHEFSEKPADMEKGWRILTKRWRILEQAGGFEENSQNASFGKIMADFP